MRKGPLGCGMRIAGFSLGHPHSGIRDGRSGRYWSPVPFVLTFLLFAASIGAYWIWGRYGGADAGLATREPAGEPVIVAPLTGRPGEESGSGRSTGPVEEGDRRDGDGETSPGPVAADRSGWTAGGGGPVLARTDPGETVPPARPAFPAVPPREGGPGGEVVPSGRQEGGEEVPGEEGKTADLLSQAREALGAGDFERALAFAEEASRRGGGPEAAELADVARHRAALLSRAREAEAENRREFEALFARGESLAGEGKWREAVQTYQAAGDRLGSSDVEDRTRLSAALDRARKAYLDGLDETDFEGWRAKALEAVEAGRWQEADEAFARAKSFGRLSPADRDKAELARRRMLREGMVLVPAGEFVMGSDDPTGREAGLRTVRLDAFLIDRCEVANVQYKRFVDETGHPPPPGWSGSEFPEDEGNHPVTGVSWYDARQYAEWAGKRLPTEEEWEKAARGTDGRLYPWGNEFEAGRANTLETGSRGPVATGAHEKGASPYGCLDMAGNALEWTLTESLGEDGESYRVLKGGCWYFPGTNTRSDKRFKDYPTSRLRSNGFRCCRDAG